jgi:hypothetical protein
MPRPAIKSIAKRPIAPLIVAAVLVTLALVAAVVYLGRPGKRTQDEPASPEAKAYVHNLALSGVRMNASENFMRQQVVEIQGKIANQGPRTLRSVDVYCLFYGVDGRQLYRERVAIVPVTGAPLRPSEVRSFRLPFDTLPDGWNQAMPKMVIAHIAFSS